MYHEKQEYNPRVKRRKRKKWLKDGAFMQQKRAELTKRPTGSEIEFRKKLAELGIEHVFQWGLFHKGFRGIADFYIEKYNLVVEVDGGYHISHEQRIKDLIRDKVLRQNMRHKVLRLDNREARNISLKELRYLIEFKAA